MRRAGHEREGSVGSGDEDVDGTVIDCSKNRRLQDLFLATGQLRDCEVRCGQILRQKPARLGRGIISDNGSIERFLRVFKKFTSLRLCYRWRCLM